MRKLSGVRLAGMIRSIRGLRVILDSDLARLYGVPTKALNQAVRRNRTRFPSDFMLVLTAEEAKEKRSQNVTAYRRNVRHRPCAFTEQGVAMLSSVLRSPRAGARARVSLAELAEVGDSRPRNLKSSVVPSQFHQAFCEIRPAPCG